MNLFNSELLYRIICIVSAVTFAGMGISLIRIRKVMMKFHGTFPDDLIPYNYLSVRRALGFAYIFTGLMVIMRLWLHVPQDTGFIFPVDGLVISASQIIIASSALLSLYDSPAVNRKTVVGNATVFVALALVYVAFPDSPAAKDIIRYVWCALCFLQMAAYTAVFFIDRRRYLKTMADRMGVEEAGYYRRTEVAAFFIFSLMIAVWSCTSIFFPTIGCVTVFLTVYTIYYVCLGIYFHNQWEDITIIQEIMSEENEKTE